MLRKWPLMFLSLGWLLSLVAAMGLIFLPAQTVASTDLTFICRKHQCQLNEPFLPMFQEDNIQPGNRFKQKLVLKNLSNELGYFYLRLSLGSATDEVSLVKALIISVDDSSQAKQVLPATFLINLLHKPKAVRLGPVLPHQTKVFTVTFKFDPQADNSFQAKLAKFDLHFTLDFLGEASKKELLALGLVTPRIKPPNFVNSTFLGQPSTSQVGQVLGLSTKRTDKINRWYRFKTTLIKQAWFRRVAPLMAAGLAMIVVSGILLLFYWFAKKSSQK